MRCIFISLLVAAQAASVAAASSRTTFLSKMKSKTKAKFIGFHLYDKVIDAPRCTCDCCIVEGRRPSENDGSATTKCSVPPSNADVGACPVKCSVVNDPIFSNFDIIVQDRFCFFECVPAGNIAPAKKVELQNAVDASFKGGSLLNTPCVHMTKDQVSLATDSDGNGRDPLFSAP